jgi:hypothetical protein
MSHPIRKSKFDIIDPPKETNIKTTNDAIIPSTGSLYSFNAETLPVGIMATIVKQELVKVISEINLG